MAHTFLLANCFQRKCFTMYFSLCSIQNFWIHLLGQCISSKPHLSNSSRLCGRSAKQSAISFAYALPHFLKDPAAKKTLPAVFSHWGRTSSAFSFSRSAYKGGLHKSAEFTLSRLFLSLIHIFHKSHLLKLWISGSLISGDWHYLRSTRPFLPLHMLPSFLSRQTQKKKKKDWNTATKVRQFDMSHTPLSRLPLLLADVQDIEISKTKRWLLQSR